ncbi:hypothetical protein LSH36_220g02038 [Paralvinella palmiformis]|uniref:Uncharacterized protein n=1 Tax=Paralvinella palmiformis TaxID=53620 RepID=A0AAD9JN81_9ANNE|nr:hypothetical protein LSH36_220g02038 [Paralvinella palmiformis]
MAVSRDTEDDLIEDYLRVGDQICLFCEESSGYVFSERTTSDTNILYTFHKQDQEKPKGINNPQVVTFRIHVQNRYKLHKRYEELKEQAARIPTDTDLQEQLKQAKVPSIYNNTHLKSHKKRF